MAQDKKIDQLDNASALDGTEKAAVVQGSKTAQTLISAIWTWIKTQDFNTAGDLYMTAVGKLLKIRSGANQRAGNATLSAGTVTVANTTITANSLIILTRKTKSGTAGNLTYTLTASTSFTITSDQATDAGVISYFIIEVV